MPSFEQLKELLHPWGPLRAQPASDWRGTTALPPAVADFYARVGPWGETYHESVGPVGCTLAVHGNPVCIPPLHRLMDYQAGYAWVSHPGQPIAGWPAHWLVIAEQGGDPFIFDTQTQQVLFAFHGAGSWKPVVFAPDLPTAVGALATVANAFSALSDKEADPDGGLAGQGRQKITDALAGFLGSQERALQMLAAWEYFE